MSASSSSTFFQICAATIPIFLLAAAASRVFRPKLLLRGLTGRWRSIGIVLVLVGLAFVLLAELVAIDGSFSNNTLFVSGNASLESEWRLYVVGAALALCTGSVGVVIASPFLEALNVPRGWIRHAIALTSMAVFLVVLGLVASDWITTTGNEAISRWTCFVRWSQTASDKSAEDLFVDDQHMVGLSSQIERLSKNKSLSPEERASELLIVRNEVKALFKLERVHIKEASPPVPIDLLGVSNLLSSVGC